MTLHARVFMTRLNENIVEFGADTSSTVFWEIPQPLPQSQKKKAVYTHKEVFGDFTIEPFTLEEALEALEISELEFQKRLESKGLCSIDDFDREGEFPVEWLKAVDTHEWILTE